MPTLLIDMNPRTIDCAVCGEPDDYKWGVPTFNGDVITNDFASLLDRLGHDTGNRAVCEACFKAHGEGDPAIEVYDVCYHRLAYYIGPFGTDGAGI